MLEGDSDVSAHFESGIMLRLSNMNVVVPLCFASHRLLRLMSITFHVLRLSNMNIVVLLCFSSHRLLRLMSMTFHVLRLSNINVVNSSLVLCIPLVAPRCVHDASCVATIKQTGTG